jgi:serine/threonine protein kinase
MDVIVGGIDDQPPENSYKNTSTFNWETKIASFSPTIFPFNDCVFGEFIGSGAAMNVYKGTCSIGGHKSEVAFKEHRTLLNSKLSQREVNVTFDDLRHEIELMGRVHGHVNVVQFIGITFKNKKPILIVELCTFDLEHYLSERHDNGNTVGWEEKKGLCLDILRGVIALHKARIVHGDLKGKNILVFFKEDGTRVAKISDFGFSSTLSSSRRDVGGSCHFIPPEYFRRCDADLTKFYTKNQTRDIYSFGLVVYQIADNGNLPYYEESNDIEKAKADDPELKTLLASLPPDTPACFPFIVTATAKRMPPERTALHLIQEILEHPGFCSLEEMERLVPAEPIRPSHLFFDHLYPN